MRIAGPSSRFPRKDIRAVDAVFAGGGFLRRGAEAIEPFQDRNRLEPHSFENLDHLCLRQSAGDSTCPEVDVPPRVFGEFDVKKDIGQVQAAAGLEHTHDFVEGALFFGNEINDPV
jgi:hypothetical protein